MLGATRSAGVTVRVKVAGKGRLTATAKLGRKVVGRASRQVRKAGTASLRLRVKRAGKVSVTVTFEPASGAIQTRTVTAKVRRRLLR